MEFTRQWVNSEIPALRQNHWGTQKVHCYAVSQAWADLESHDFKSGKDLRKQLVQPAPFYCRVGSMSCRRACQIPTWTGQNLCGSHTQPLLPHPPSLGLSASLQCGSSRECGKGCWFKNFQILKDLRAPNFVGLLNILCFTKLSAVLAFTSHHDFPTASAQIVLSALSFAINRAPEVD